MKKNRILKGKQAKKLLAEIVSISRKIDRIFEKFNGTADEIWDQAEGEIREIIRQYEQENYEYLTIIRLDGLSMIHVNPLREGKRYTKKEDLDSTKVKEPTLQLYSRDTGEILIDAAVPIILKGKHEYTVRASMIVIQTTLFSQLLRWVILPPTIVFATFLYLIPEKLWFGFAATMITSFISTGILTSKWKKELKTIKKGLTELTRGNVEIHLKPTFRHELAQIIYGTNNVAIGLKNHIQELKTQLRIMENNVGTINNNGIESETIASRLKKASLEISENSEKQVNHMNSVSSLMEELAATFQQLSASIQEAASSTKQAYGMSLDGETKMDELQKEMAGLQSSFEQMNAATNNLIVSLSEIEKFVNIIGKIAEQTNILALNASIEAARAGQEGKGFAVVAEQIRKLANESKITANEISVVVTHAQTERNNSQESVEQGIKSLDNVVLTLNKTQKLFHNIAGNVSALNHGIDEVANAIQGVASGTNETTDSVVEVTQMSENILKEIYDITSQTTAQQDIAINLNLASQELDKISVHIKNIVDRFVTK